ncbi:MAG: SEC-C metal-binding domain-containing protein, partial [Bacteroidota bacterium]|nr:SEC-C metal-binding domain-containing protein [Bacteroidota bacterium]
EVIQHPLITRSVERAQKKVEENNFAIRKRLLEYDNVMNQQREVIYNRRRHALEGERLKSEILDLLDEYISEIVDKYFENAEIEAMKEEILHNLLVDFKLEPDEFTGLGKDGIKDRIMEAAKEFYKRKEEMMGSDLMARLERYAVLSVIDDKWKEHLREMDELKEGIGLRAYGQKDPLIEYKGEAFNMFVSLLGLIRNDIISFCFKFWPQAPEEIQERRKRQPVQRIREVKAEATNIGIAAGDDGQAVNQPGDGAGREGMKLQPVHVEEKVGRNDPCPCGSGKKFKNCHGK